MDQGPAASASLIFLFCSARSGSTWLAKIFDSHPDLLYLHEPDIHDRGSDLLPYWFADAPGAADIENARRYLERLIRVRALRTVGIRPFFRKSYRGTIAEELRLGMVYGAKLAERAGLSRLANGLEIPDYRTRGSSPPMVIKSVSALGRADALVSAMPSMTPVLLVRHPCGFVASMLRGEKLGVMPPVERLGRMLETRSARRLGLTPEAIENADHAALLAWTWLVSNLEAMEAITRVKGIVLRYPDVALEPRRHIVPLFERLGLGWPRQTDEFLARSQESHGDYYSIYRDAAAVADQWSKELDVPTIARIRDIVERDPLGAGFFARQSE